jgi:exonuclease III
LAPDVAVLAEVAQAPRALAPSLFQPQPSWHWVGINPGKGLAVASFGVPSVPIVAQAAGRWSVAARLGDKVVLGIWSCPSGGGGAVAYEREVLRGLDGYARGLGDRPLVVAGDFNVVGRAGGFPRLARRLQALGLQSAYHRFFDEPLGAEIRPTYFHLRDRMRPFHIDFCFLSETLLDRLIGVEVGHYEDWVQTGLSDHVPLVVELAD